MLGSQAASLSSLHCKVHATAGKERASAVFAVQFNFLATHGI